MIIDEELSESIRLCAFPDAAATFASLPYAGNDEMRK